MKTNLLLLACLLVFFFGFAQDTDHPSSTMEQSLENLTQANDAETEDDGYLQQLEQYRRHPLNINTATETEVEQLEFLTALQVQQLLLYRKLLGKLINPYELQAIPAWDLTTIRKILPFIAVTDEQSLVQNLRSRWKGGDAILIARAGRVIERSKGFEKTTANGYLGNREKIYSRYTYNYKNLLQWGVLADKDAGEQFFSGHQQQGFDFYSIHFFARQLGLIKALALGDFTVNLGQGLVQWQSLAFKKSAAVLNIKRQSAVLRPYNSAGEYNFQRGAGITLQKANWQTTLFISYRKISANTVPDTAFGDGAISSFLTSGYHRTTAENDTRNGLRQWAAGGNMQYNGQGGHLGVNAVYYRFSKPVQKADEPYNLFALQGTRLLNASLDYGFTWRNMHFFGEAATDELSHHAFLSGALISLASQADFSVLYRTISPGYRSVNANAFTENTFPANETGLYTGLSVRPLPGWRIDGYADLFRFPWLKYRVDAPSAGHSFFLQATYTPTKRLEWYARYASETKMINRSAANTNMAITEQVPEKDLRMQADMVLGNALTVKNRVELLWYNKAAAPGAGQGFLSFIEAFYKPLRKRWRGNLRLQYFETDGYNERIYGYEADMPYGFSIPFYYDKGFRYYLNMNWNASGILHSKRQKKPTLNLWLRWAQTIYPGKTVIGTGLDEIKGNTRSELKCQLILVR